MAFCRKLYTFQSVYLYFIYSAGVSQEALYFIFYTTKYILKKIENCSEKEKSLARAIIHKGGGDYFEMKGKKAPLSRDIIYGNVSREGGNGKRMSTSLEMRENEMSK